MADGTLPETYVYDYEKRLKRNGALQKARNSSINPNRRLGSLSDAEMMRRLNTFKKNTSPLMQSNNNDPYKNMEELPKCIHCKKILFIDGRCPNGCRQ